MAFTNITLETRDLIGTLTLNRPEKLNAMTPTLIAEMGEALTQIEKDPAIKVVVVRGAGRAFCTGYDLTVGLSDGSGQRYTLDDDQRSLQHYVEHWLRLRDLPKPVISMVHGYCLAGGIAARHLYRHHLRRGKCQHRVSVDTGGRRLCQFILELDGGAASHQVHGVPSRQPDQRQRGGSYRIRDARVSGREPREQETYDYARRVAKVPAQKLRLEKLAINRALDIQGFRTAVLAGAEFDAIFHFGPGNEEIRAIQKERGLRGAIQWYEQK